MPIEELLALYNCVSPPALHSTISSTNRRLSSRSRGGRRSSRQTSSKESAAENISKTPISDEVNEISQNTNVTTELNDESIRAEKPSLPKIKNEAESVVDKEIAENAIESNEHKSNQNNNNCEEVTVVPVTHAGDIVAVATNINPPDNPKITKGSNRDRDLTRPTADDVDDDDEDDEEEEEEESELRKLYPETYKNKDQRLLRGKYIGLYCNSG